MTLHCIILRITLHCIALHYITLHYITLHYITCKHTHAYIHACIRTHVHTYIRSYVHPCICMGAMLQTTLLRPSFQSADALKGVGLRISHPTCHGLGRTLIDKGQVVSSYTAHREKAHNHTKQSLTQPGTHIFLKQHSIACQSGLRQGMSLLLLQLLLF